MPCMATPQSLEDTIRKECLPLGDCMLTITDASGEAAFLYFKGGELIEANYAALWGRDALAQIVNWKLADRMVAPLPLGIKRSLWDPIEFLLNPGSAASASGRISKLPSFQAQKITPTSPFDRFKNIPSLLKMIHIEKGKGNVLHEMEGESENTDWLNDFTERAKAVLEPMQAGDRSQKQRGVDAGIARVARRHTHLGIEAARPVVNRNGESGLAAPDRRADKGNDAKRVDHIAAELFLELGLAAGVARPAFGKDGAVAGHELHPQFAVLAAAQIVVRIVAAGRRRAAGIEPALRDGATAKMRHQPRQAFAADRDLVAIGARGFMPGGVVPRGIV